jgi:hypothetical protein
MGESNGINSIHAYPIGAQGPKFRGTRTKQERGRLDGSRMVYLMGISPTHSPYPSKWWWYNFFPPYDYLMKEATHATTLDRSGSQRNARCKGRKTRCGRKWSSLPPRLVSAKTTTSTDDRVAGRSANFILGVCQGCCLVQYSVTQGVAVVKGQRIFSWRADAGHMPSRLQEIWENS